MNYKIAVVGAGYVGLSLAVLLSQKNNVKLIDIDENKIDLINRKISPLKDEYIEKYLSDEELCLQATKHYEEIYKDAQIVVIATPTNYDVSKNYFDTSSVESVIEQISSINSDAIIVVKSTVPVGFTKRMKERHHNIKMLFSPEFLRESKALYDNLYPSRIIVGCDENTKGEAEIFSGLLCEAALKRILLC